MTKGRARPMNLGSQKNFGPFGGPKRPKKAKGTQRPDIRKDRELKICTALKTSPEHKKP